MRFQKIDFQTWERTKEFRFFMNNLRNVISITVDLDVTVFLRRVKARGQKFYPSMLWAVSCVVNAHEEFRMGRNAEGEYGIYDLNIICNLCPDILPLLNAPYGTAFERDKNSEWQKLELLDDED